MPLGPYVFTCLYVCIYIYLYRSVYQPLIVSDLFNTLSCACYMSRPVDYWINHLPTLLIFYLLITKLFTFIIADSLQPYSPSWHFIFMVNPICNCIIHSVYFSQSRRKRSPQKNTMYLLATVGRSYLRRITQNCDLLTVNGFTECARARTVHCQRVSGQRSFFCHYSFQQTKT